MSTRLRVYAAEGYGDICVCVRKRKRERSTLMNNPRWGDGKIECKLIKHHHPNTKIPSMRYI